MITKVSIYVVDSSNICLPLNIYLTSNIKLLYIAMFSLFEKYIYYYYYYLWHLQNLKNISVYSGKNLFKKVLTLLSFIRRSYFGGPNTQLSTQSGLKLET